MKNTIVKIFGLFFSITLVCSCFFFGEPIKVPEIEAFPDIGGSPKITIDSIGVSISDYFYTTPYGKIIVAEYSSYNKLKGKLKILNKKYEEITSIDFDKSDRSSFYILDNGSIFMGKTRFTKYSDPDYNPQKVTYISTKGIYYSLDSNLTRSEKGNAYLAKITKYFKNLAYAIEIDSYLLLNYNDNTAISIDNPTYVVPYVLEDKNLLKQTSYYLENPRLNNMDNYAWRTVKKRTTGNHLVFGVDKYGYAYFRIIIGKDTSFIKQYTKKDYSYKAFRQITEYDSLTKSFDMVRDYNSSVYRVKYNSDSF